MFFLNKFYAYALAFVALAYAVYALAIEPRLELKEANTKLDKAEENISVLASNTDVSIVDELNKHDANNTQIKIDKAKDKYENEENVSVDVIKPDGSHEWVFFSN